MNDKIIKSNLATVEHIREVRKNIYEFVRELDHRAQIHDASKLQSPEQEIFGEHYEQLGKVEYGSPEYAELLQKVKPAIEHHYANNRHHPEHWPNGIRNMTLLDLLEMLADWRAATKRNKNGNIRKSIEINAKKYNMPPELQEIFENTIREVFKD